MATRIGWIWLAAVAAFVVAPIRAEGQNPPPVRSLLPSSRKEPARATIPESHLPPAGMCRIWIDNVPPAQQPAPTDCATAIRNRPSNGRVIFAEDGVRGERDVKEEKGEEKRVEKGERGAKGERAEKGRKRRKPIE